MKKSKELPVSLIGAVIGLISLILFAIVSGDGENDASAVWVYIMLIAALVLEVVSFCFYEKLQKMPLVLSGVRFCQTALYVIAAGAFVTARINWLFRLMSKMSAAPLTALFPITIGAMLLAVIVHVVSTYLPENKA